MKINQIDLENLATDYEEELKKDGFNVVIKPYWAYGAYSYMFNFDTPQGKRQVATTLDTKKQCYARMKEAYYQILNNAEYYKGAK